MLSPRDIYPSEWFETSNCKSKSLPMMYKGKATARAGATAKAKACPYTVRILPSGCRLLQMSSGPHLLPAIET